MEKTSEFNEEMTKLSNSWGHKMAAINARPVGDFSRAASLLTGILFAGEDGIPRTFENCKPKDIDYFFYSARFVYINSKESAQRLSRFVSLVEQQTLMASDSGMIELPEFEAGYSYTDWNYDGYMWKSLTSERHKIDLIEAEAINALYPNGKNEEV